MYYNKVNTPHSAQNITPQTTEPNSVPMLSDTLEGDKSISTPPSELSFGSSPIGITGAGLF